MAVNVKLVTVSWRERERYVLAPTLEIREQKRYFLWLSGRNINILRIDTSGILLLDVMKEKSNVHTAFSFL